MAPQSISAAPARVWEFADGDELWLSRADDAETALAEYMAEYGVTREDAVGDEESLPVALTDEILDRAKIRMQDDGGNFTEEVLTYREWMERLLTAHDTVLPCCFAARDC